jgi:glycosyltransferase involved in cell wall biosynthesis
VAISQYSAGELVQNYGVAPQAIRVIYLGVHDHELRRTPQLRRDAQTRVLFVGRLGRQKGIDRVIRVASMFSDRREVVFDVIGPEDYPRDAALSGPLPANVRLHGPVPHRELGDWFGNSDIFFFPTRGESFGIVVAEAMGAHLPVIATRGSAISDLVVDGVTGVLADGDDIAAFARALSRLIDDRDLRQQMGNAGFSRVKERFTWRRTAEFHRSLYQELVGGER